MNDSSYYNTAMWKISTFLCHYHLFIIIIAILELWKFCTMYFKVLSYKIQLLLIMKFSVSQLTCYTECMYV